MIADASTLKGVYVILLVHSQVIAKSNAPELWKHVEGAVY